jgi:hypothetical protein
MLFMSGFPVAASSITRSQCPTDGHQSTTNTESSIARSLSPGCACARVDGRSVDGNAAVDAKFAELTEAGYHGRREPWLTSFNAYMCMVDDPDGNTVLVTAG